MRRLALKASASWNARDDTGGDRRATKLARIAPQCLQEVRIAHCTRKTPHCLQEVRIAHCTRRTCALRFGLRRTPADSPNPVGYRQAPKSRRAVKQNYEMPLLSSRSDQTTRVTV